MKPNFALNLSFEGIGLLHRAGEVWHRVGEVPLDVPDMAKAFELLRKTAEELTDDPLIAKLLLPDEQIKYMRLADPGGSEEIRQAAVRAALDGTTPYSLDELAIDWAERDGELTVAAVAKETLQEAESFVREHGFEPLYFCAAPEAGLFAGEPYFGETAFSAEHAYAVERDNGAVVIGGIARKPEPEPKEELVAPPEETPAFSSRRTSEDEGAAPSLSGVTRGAVSSTSPIIPGAELSDEEAGPAPALHAQPEPSSKSAPAPIPVPQSRNGKAAEQNTERGVMSFFSRRNSKGDNDLPKASAAPSMRSAAPKMPPPNVVPPATSEKQRLTIFGARKPETESSSAARKPRLLGLILTAVLLIFLIGVGAWASIFVDDGLSGLFGRSEKRLAHTAPDLVDELEIEGEEAMVLEVPVETASLGTATDGINSDGLRPTPNTARQLTLSEAQEKYAVTGIWALAPEIPPLPAAQLDDDIYIPSIDAQISAVDAIALPQLSASSEDAAPGQQTTPVGEGKTFALNERGLVIATPEGALSPDGHMVFAGKPPLVPQSIPQREQTAPLPEAQAARLAAFRPKARPEGLIEGNERALLGGLTRAELGAIRPKMRPASAQQIAQISPAEQNGEITPGAVAIRLNDESAPDLDPNATAQAVAQSIKPKTRPRNFSRIVESAKSASDETVTRVAAVAPKTVSPSIPSRASVAKQATVRNAINLRRVNLIGVYGKPSSRRALVRLANGRYKKVKVGDRIDGGRVSAIGDSELRYQKNGRNVTLKMPRG